MDDTNTSFIPINQTSFSAETPNLNTLPFGFKLNETNFKIWSRMLELHAAGLNKLGYLTGQNARVEEGNYGYSKWCPEDAVVR